MDSTRSNDRSRAEVDHSKPSYNRNRNTSVQGTLALSFESYSEPLPQSRVLITEENEENQAPSMFTMPPSSHNRDANERDVRSILKRFDEISTSNHHDARAHEQETKELEDVNCPFEQLVEAKKSINLTVPDEEEDNEEFSEPEPSATPVVSDLDEMFEVDSRPNSVDRNLRVNLVDVDLPSSASPARGSAYIPYIMDDEDSETPEPLDTPQTPGGHDYDACYNQIEYKQEEEAVEHLDEDAVNFVNLRMVSAFSSDHEHDLSDADMSLDMELDLDLDLDLEDAVIPAELAPPTLQSSTSWEQKVVRETNISFNSSKMIKCITPITQQMAEMRIRRRAPRRRSVANITPSIHRLFQLDPDLLQIRDEFERLNKEKKGEKARDGDVDPHDANRWPSNDDHDTSTKKRKRKL